MLAFAVALTTGTGILVGLAPALHVSKRDLNAVMKQDAAVAGSGPRGGRLRAVLVGVQVALCMALVIAAGLLLRGLHATYSVDPGFEPGDVTYVSFEPVLGAYDGEEISELRHAIRTGVEALPGVEAVAWTDREPLGDDSAGIAIRRPGEPEHLLRPAQLHAVGPDYFTLLRLPIVRGRSFTESEADNATSDVRPAVVSETTARNLWADEDPLGQALLWRAGPEREVTLHIIGVTADAQLTAIGHIDPYSVFVPAPAGAVLLVRSRGGFEATGADIRREVTQVEPVLAASVFPLEATLAWWRSISGTVAATGSALALLALVLASVGVFGVVSYTVTRRYQEIGIRVALGATARDVLATILWQTMRPVVAGAAVGLAAAGALSGTLASLLFGVSPVDPIGIGAAALLVIGMALAAGVTAARPVSRAAAVSPVAALQERRPSVWHDARQTVRRMVRDLGGGPESPGSPLTLSEFTAHVHRATSFPEAVRIALATLQTRLGAQSALLFEGTPAGCYRAGDCTIPADGLLARRLQHFPHVLPLGPGDFRTWRRWADAHRPEHVAEIEMLERTDTRIAVPLRARDELIAMLLLGAPEGRERFTDAETAVLSSAADVFALLLENGKLNARALEQEKVRRDLALAAEVQRRLLPRQVPDRDAVSCAAFTAPARTVGGDYYDFIDLGHDRMGIAVADISGKGIAAALLMSAVQAWVRLIAAEAGAPVSELAVRMNRLFHRSMATNAYAPFFYAQLDVRTLRLRYVNAGHHPPCVMRSTEEGIVTTPLCAGGTVVGLFPDAQYEEGTFDLRPGDRLFAFTDGVTEARNAAGEEFGGERLKALLQNRVGASAEEISTDVADVIRQWTDGAEHQDDVTFVVLAVNTPAIRSAPAGHSIQPTQGTVLLSRHSAPRSVEPSADARSVSSASQATQSRSSRSGLRSSQGRSRRSM